MIWQAIDEKGNVCKPYITDATLNSETYLRECIKKRLLPFIHQHHKTRKIFFWPDLASCHYASSVQVSLKELGISFPPRNENPPSVPQVRPIERFWALCKARYSQLPKPPKSLQGFKRIWSRISKEVAQKSGKKLMKKTRVLLRRGSTDGPLAVLD